MRQKLNLKLHNANKTIQRSLYAFQCLLIWNLSSIRGMDQLWQSCYECDYGHVHGKWEHGANTKPTPVPSVLRVHFHHSLLWTIRIPTIEMIRCAALRHLPCFGILWLFSCLQQLINGPHILLDSTSAIFVWSSWPQNWRSTSKQWHLIGFICLCSHFSDFLVEIFPFDWLANLTVLIWKCNIHIHFDTPRFRWKLIEFNYQDEVSTVSRLWKTNKLELW